MAKAEIDPSKIALIVTGDDETRLSYHDLETRIRAIGTGFLKMGLAPGDRILMRIGNTVDFPVVFLAAIAVGLIPIPTSSQLTVAEVTLIATDIQPALVVAQDGMSLPDCNIAVMRTNALNEMSENPKCDYLMGDPNRPAYIIYTSGTSGKPRAVLHAHRAIWARKAMFDGWYGLTIADRVLHAGAFNWTFTLGTGLLDPWTIGATAIVPAVGMKPDNLGVLLQDQAATIFAAAPGVYRKLVGGNIPPLPSLRHGLSAGEKLPASVAQVWQAKTGTLIFEAFGMSECSTFISSSTQLPATKATIGHIQAGRNVKILDKKGPVSTGNIGVIGINVSEVGLMLGYFNPDGSCHLPNQDGWFLTGDLASQNSDGAVIYQGRIDDMMNAGGYRVSPLEVESVLNNHDEIQDVACCELSVKPDVTVIAGFYTSRNLIPHDNLHGFVSSQLAAYKCPRMYVHVDALPRGRNNKLLRQKLRQDWETANGQT